MEPQTAEMLAVRSRVQPAWVTMPTDCLAALLDELSGLSGTDLEDALRAEVLRRFRYQERPPRWLHDEIWPVNANGPLTFVEQIDMSSGEHQSYGYVFRDDVTGERTMLMQSELMQSEATDRAVAAGSSPAPGAVVPGPAAPVVPVVPAPAVASLSAAGAAAGADPADVEATVMVDRSALGQWSLVLEDGRTFDLWSASVVVGRRPRAALGVQTLTIPDEALTLSKTHARLDLVDGTWQVTDLGSTNGVVVAGADGQDTEVARGGAAPVYGYLELGSVGARIVPTSQVDGMLPLAEQSGSTVSLEPAESLEPADVPSPVPDPAADPAPDEGDADPPTDRGTTSGRETAAVRQFVAGTVPLGVFVQLLHRDLPLRQYLASGGGLEEYAQADLLGTMLRVAWQDPVSVRDAQQVLERFLRAQGVDVDPTGLYQERVDLDEKLRPLLAGLQTPWLKIPVPYLARLLEECGDQTGDGFDDLVRRRVESRFRFLTHPPQWLHDELWPVGRHGPLVFVEQVDAAPDRPGTAVNYVFVDPRNGAFLVLPQTLPAPVADDPPPTPAELQLPRGVVPVLARPGAFWLTQPDAGRGPAPGGQDDDEAGDGRDGEPGTGAPAEPSDQPQTASPVPVRTEPVEVEPLAGTAEEPAEQLAGTAEEPAEQLAGTAEESDLETTVTSDLPSFQPWTLALADGRSFSVQSRSVVVGRRPQTGEPGVQALAIADSTRSLSKTHARLDLVGGTWQVTDLGSTNGVVVTTADGQETKAEPGQPAPVYGYVVFGSVEARLQPDQAG